MKKSAAEESHKTPYELMQEQIEVINKDLFSAENIKHDVELCRKKYPAADPELIRPIIETINNTLISYFRDIKTSNNYRTWSDKSQNIKAAFGKLDTKDDRFQQRSRFFKEFYKLRTGQITPILQLASDSPVEDAAIYKKISKAFSKHKAKKLILEIFPLLPKNYQDRTRSVWSGIIDFDESKTSATSLARFASLSAKAAQEPEIQTGRERLVRFNSQNQVKIMSQESDGTESYTEDEELESASESEDEEDRTKSLAINSGSESEKQTSDEEHETLTRGNTIRKRKPETETETEEDQEPSKKPKPDKEGTTSLNKEPIAKHSL